MPSLKRVGNAGTSFPKGTEVHPSAPIDTKMSRYNNARSNKQLLTMR